MANPVLARVRKQREKTVELEAGKKLTFLRPPEAELGDLLKPVEGDPTKAQWVIEIEHVVKYAVGWEGFTEADLLGAAIGSSDVVEFDRDLWAEVVGDRAEWKVKVANAILGSVVDHLTAREAVAKNSVPA